ncbi:hypothetical protein A6R68_04221, partial [Neotoma lepida]
MAKKIKTPDLHLSQRNTRAKGQTLRDPPDTPPATAPTKNTNQGHQSGVSDPRSPEERVWLKFQRRRTDKQVVRPVTAATISE